MHRHQLSLSQYTASSMSFLLQNHAHFFQGFELMIELNDLKILVMAGLHSFFNSFICLYISFIVCTHTGCSTVPSRFWLDTPSRMICTSLWSSRTSVKYLASSANSSGTCLPLSSCLNIGHCKARINTSTQKISWYHTEDKNLFKNQNQKSVYVHLKEFD